MVSRVCLFLGERLRFLSSPDPSLRDGDDGLDEEPIHDLRAKLLIVPVTDRPKLFGVSVSPLEFLASVSVPSSSADRENLAVVIFFFAFLDALRKSSLFTFCIDSEVLVLLLSACKVRTFSEKVRLMIGCEDDSLVKPVR